MKFSNLISTLQRRFSAQPRLSPHYVHDYNKVVGDLIRSLPESTAMARAVGGEFHSFGVALKSLVIQCGLKDGMTLVDVGCGSGRLAVALRQMNIAYLGTDVVPELLAYAKRMCDRPDWRFELNHNLSIPMPDASAGMVVFTSVLTHLRHEESFIYLTEAKRVLKPTGVIVFTFLDFSQPHHWIIFQQYVERMKAGRSLHVDQFIDKPAIEAWAKMLDLRIKQIFDGSENYIRLSEEVTLDNGTKLSGNMTIGQSTCVLEKL